MTEFINKCHPMVPQVIYMKIIGECWISTNLIFSKSKRKSISAIMVFMLIGSGCLGFSMVIDTSTAEPVVIGEKHGGRWYDTFNDTTGIVDMGGVAVNEKRGDVTLNGYWNNFDNEPLGDISGWIYEVLSNPMAHRVENDPYESGKTLFLARNDNMANYDEHWLWIEFYSYYEIIDFDLTPYQMDGSNKQSYFYIEFYNYLNNVIHEVRYYWNDYRSGVPANTSTLTAVDLNWPIPDGLDLEEVKFVLHEDISDDIDANIFVNQSDVIINTTKVRYGFYQDAGPDWAQIDQVYIDNLGIHPPNNAGYLTSAEITCPEGFYWNNIIVNKTEPGIGNYITITVIDGDTFEVIDSLSDLSESVISISSIDSIEHPSIRLVADFTGNGSSTPVLHNLTVKWTDDSSVGSSEKDGSDDLPWFLFIILILLVIFIIIGGILMTKKRKSQKSAPPVYQPQQYYQPPRQEMNLEQPPQRNEEYMPPQPQRPGPGNP